MTNLQLLEAIGMIDEEIILDAEKEPTAKVLPTPRGMWMRKLTAVVACLAVIVGGAALMMPGGWKDNNDPSGEELIGATTAGLGPTTTTPAYTTTTAGFEVEASTTSAPSTTDARPVTTTTAAWTTTTAWTSGTVATTRPTTTTTTAATSRTAIPTTSGPSVIPDLYPEAWCELNAVLVRWGSPTGKTYEDWSRAYRMTTGKDQPIEYTEVKIEGLTVYGETMTEALRAEFERLSVLYVPTAVLDQAVPGTTSLVFLERYYAKDILWAHYGPAYTRVMYEGESLDAAMYAVTDQRIAVPEYLYDTAYVKGFDVWIHLYEANAYIREQGASVPLFVNGMTLDEFARFLAYITK